MSDNKETRHEQLSKAFGIDHDMVDANLPIPIDETKSTELIVTEEDEQFEQDFQDARARLVDIANKSQLIIGKMIPVVEDSETPRAYEVLGRLLKDSAEINKDILDAYSKREEIKQTRGGGGRNQGVNIKDSNVIVAPTSDILKALEEKK